MEERGEIIMYQPDSEVKLEVRLEDETVWLTQAQMAMLFQTTPQNVTIHIRSIYKEEELDKTSTCKDSLQVRFEGSRQVQRIQKFYNLDVIISVGYRIKSKRGTQFRIWANKVLKEYLLRGYSVNRLRDVERRVDDRLAEHEHRLNQIDSKIDFFVRTSLPPVEGIFYDGQIFDAYKFASDLIKSARKSIILIDNYVVTAEIYTQSISRQLSQDLEKYNSQYEPIEIRVYKNSHDRFLIIDGADVYHIGASLKDLGKKMFAFSKLAIPASAITGLF